MAMNKAERAELDKARADLAAAKAMSWPSYPMPRRLPVPGGNHGVTGWDFNLYAAMPDVGAWEVQRALREAWSRATAHGEGHDWNRSGSQGARPPYATKAEALRAMRIIATERAARTLASIDALIKEAEAETGEPGDGE